MLRRPPTTIRLTTEDILAYDDRNLKKQSANQNMPPDTQSPLQRTNQPKPTRDQRIGVSR
uniref:ARAD1C03036p n=1 Tax=Blastobotrys adeninivorans TaxID=409370 RepID=A0A060T549_BLAAD